MCDPTVRAQGPFRVGDLLHFIIAHGAVSLWVVLQRPLRTIELMLTEIVLSSHYTPPVWAMVLSAAEILADSLFFMKRCTPVPQVGHFPWTRSAAGPETTPSVATVFGALHFMQ